MIPHGLKKTILRLVRSYYAILAAAPSSTDGAAAAPALLDASGAPLAPGVSVRFVKLDVDTERDATARVVERVANKYPTLQLGTPLLKGSPPGHAFASGCRITAPLKGGAAPVEKVLFKTDDAPWAELPPSGFAQRGDGRESCTLTVTSLAAYYAILTPRPSEPAAAAVAVLAVHAAPPLEAEAELHPAVEAAFCALEDDVAELSVTADAALDKAAASDADKDALAAELEAEVRHAHSSFYLSSSCRGAFG